MSITEAIRDAVGDALVDLREVDVHAPEFAKEHAAYHGAIETLLKLTMALAEQVEGLEQDMTVALGQSNAALLETDRLENEVEAMETLLERVSPIDLRILRPSRPEPLPLRPAVLGASQEATQWIPGPLSPDRLMPAHRVEVPADDSSVPF